MTHPVEISFSQIAADKLAGHKGRVAVIVAPGGRLPAGLPRAASAAARRALDSKAGKALKPGASIELAFPAGMAADALQLIALPARASAAEARKAGAAIGAKLGTVHTLVVAGAHRQANEIALGIALRGYDFSVYQSKPDADDTESESDKARVTFMVKEPEALAKSVKDGAAVAEGVFFTRDLVNEPANVLTTSDFADRLKAMEEIGLTVEVLEEDELSKLGMRALLAVGQGSESPSKVVVMRWNGGGDEAPLALVGKGVVFDTGGISIKPAAGMESMTMDMGGAGVVAGVMRTLALRQARANVVGLVGLVENMPDGRAQRPGDIVKSMKGDTIEIVNTDAEGRLVLADVLWYAQTRFEPKAVIDLATLTGAVIIALGHDNAGVFSNDDKLAANLLAAAGAEGEGAWRLPLGPGYDSLIKSRLADIKNSGGRSAGSITAAQFLQRFIRKDQPWAHIDIAGVALPEKAPDLAPKGASGWGVMTLDRLVRDKFEGK
ncbi:leucyl aminopeptidase [Paracoccus onubensis]|uniref:Probable cytosol aminopeptidase n=1 Tax=Paracoccus onubensis TaxID=1675788 RepID=A0A418SV98_9RHOB|nr:leucyl aminopeptidase [Paracoccus onubensis]RJE84859.1 leucyl aminopeptidase [Paracoccus onubensis]